MHRRTAAVLLSGALLTGVAGVAAVTPASAADGSPSRLSAVGDALKGLVTDGTLTQAQADTVAKTLADQAPPPRGPGGGPGWHGPGLEKAAEVLGLTTDELRSQLRAGSSLADVAGTKDVTVAELVAALVTKEQAVLAQAVIDGRITQEQADARTGTLTQRVTDRVNGVRPEPGPGRPGFGHRHGHGPADPAAPAPAVPAPAAPSGTTVPSTSGVTTA